MMTDVQALAALRVRYEVAGYANCAERAVDALVWAKTGGMAEVERLIREIADAKRRNREYHEAQQVPGPGDANPDGTPPDSAQKCPACGGRGRLDLPTYIAGGRVERYTHNCIRCLGRGTV
jgi:hypothetical protein